MKKAGIMVKVCWTGAAGLEFTFNGETILVDPYYTRISKFNMLFGKVSPDLDLINRIKEKKDPITAIVAGHTHFDHVMDIPGFAANSDCKVIGSESLDTLMNLHKIQGRTIVCSGNEKIQITNDISVTMIPSEHGLVAFGKVPFKGEISALSTLPMKACDYRLGKVFTPEIEIMGKKFLHMGSAGFIKKELAGRKCDVVFLCVPGWENKQKYPEEIIELTEPDTVVLFHFDDFFKKYKKLKNKTKQLMFLNMDNMIKRIKKFAPEVKIIVPELFEPFEF